MAPATPFQNIVDNFTEDRINRIKVSAEEYQKRRAVANGTATETTTEVDSTDDIPW